MQECEGRFTFKGTWRLTYLSLIAKPETTAACTAKSALLVTNFYSDLLYQPFLCASIRLPDSWLSNSNIPKRSKLSLAEFREQYETTNQPVVITDVVSSFQKWSGVARHKMVIVDRSLDWKEI